jgi:hypothetical protein
VGTIWIKELTGGLDTRRMPENTAGGVLILANNGHISRGGEFEKRAAFVPTYALPPGTVGLSTLVTGLLVYGSDPAPSTVPFGVTYQRLQHPDTVTKLTRVLSDTLFSGKRYTVGEFSDGSVYHFYDGVRVTDWFDGRARASFTVTSNAGTLSNLTVGGVAVISSPVAWAGSAEAMASAIASAINTYTSTPDYQATAAASTVSIISATPGAAANGQAVVATLSSLTISPADGIVLASGAEDATGGYVPGTFVKTVGSKIYSVSGPNLHFSGIKQPTQWKTDAVGAGFIDMSSQAEGAEQLQAIAKYQGYLAVFAERIIQIEYVDPDPGLNKISQTLENTGTASPRSVTAFGDSDIWYLDESGVRSLRARDASNAAATSDTGVPVDTLITAKLKTFDTEQRERIIGLIEPGDGRFMLIMRDEIFVFSYFPGSKISAWSTYTPSYVNDAGATVMFEVEDAVTFRRRVYLRSGDTVYVLGGLGTSTTYDGTEAEAWLPLLDAGTPAKFKDLEGVDAAVEGTWEVRMAMDPTDLTASDKIATLTQSTFPDKRIPAEGSSTHFGLRFKTLGDGPAKLGAAVIHYAGGDED